MDNYSDAFFTLVVHTEARANRLKEILEFHKIEVKLEDLNVPGASGVAAKCVRIPVSALELGLKILESGQSAASPFSIMKITGVGNSLLIPVDFSPASMLAVRIGFFLASRFNVEPIVMHAFLAPAFPSEPFAEDLENPGTPLMEETMEEITDYRKIAAEQLARFKKQIHNAQKQGSVTDIHFSTTLLEGVPEQVINEYCRDNKPLMVVMATRGVHKKEADLVGSVTAEVIDACRVPVFTIPEECAPIAKDSLKNVLFFCTLTPVDILNMRGLMKLADYPASNVYLLPVSERSYDNVTSTIEDVAHVFSQSYPTATFHLESFKKGKFEDNLRVFLNNHDIDVIIVPNKKSTAFSRFFKPTLAHRILFDKDIPLLVLPV